MFILFLHDFDQLVLKVEKIIQLHETEYTLFVLLLIGEKTNKYPIHVSELILSSWHDFLCSKNCN